MIGQTIAHYTIIEKIGAGGMGEVYLAEDTKLKRKVALKFLPGQFTSDADTQLRFQREAQALATLQHANIVAVFEVSEHEGAPFIAMEYVDGRALKQLAADGEISLDQIINLGTQMCDGLAAAHEEKIVHRDIKSDNILLSRKGQIKIMDFGLATWKGAASITRASSTVGTVAYMSPEQAEGGVVDHRSDLFSLGVVLYELITGHLPFHGEHEAAVLYSIIHEAPTPLERYRSGLPPGLQPILDKLLDKDPETRYQSAAGVAADLRRLKKDSSPSVKAYEKSAAETVSAQAAEKKPARRAGLLIGGTLLAAVVLVLLILKPWSIVVKPTEEAAAVENRLAVMYFDNLADPDDAQRTGEIASSLLISAMSASRDVQVVSDQRLYDILKLLNHEGERSLGRDVASQVAERADARWMLTGSILRTQPNIELTAQLIDVRSGDVLASPRISGAAGEDLFALIDSLSAKIRNQLAIPGVASREDAPTVASLTTSSTEAYAHYLRGWEYFHQYKNREAEHEFNAAIAADSNFAQAYYGLSFVAVSTDSKRYRQQLLARALQRAGDLGEKDRLLIEARSDYLNDRQEEAIATWEKLTKRFPDEKEAYWQLSRVYRTYPLKDDEKVVAMLQQVIRIDPLFKDAYNALAYDFERLGDMDKSIRAINKYIELAPDEPNPYDSRGELYGYVGQLDLAIASYRKALQIDSMYAPSAEKLAYCFLLKQDYESADRILRAGASITDRFTRSGARTARVDVPLFQGRLKDALGRANAALEADLIEFGNNLTGIWGSSMTRREVLEDMAELYEEPQWYDSAANVIATLASRLSQDTSQTEYELLLREVQSRLFADRGEFNRADSLILEIVAELDSTSQEGQLQNHRLRAHLELRRSRYEAAIPHLLWDLKEHATSADYIQLGRAYLGKGSIGEAVEMLEKALNRYDGPRLYNGVASVRVHFWLAQAYERSGWTDKAAEQYGIFLDKWKNADPEIKILGVAREHLAALKHGVG